jgi:hypothetical protein
MLASSDGTGHGLCRSRKIPVLQLRAARWSADVLDEPRAGLKLLMDKAEQGTGGAVVNVIAYQADYVTAREELKVIDATARAKNCDAPRRP